MANCDTPARANEHGGNAVDQAPTTTAVRYGKMGFVGEFSHPPGMEFHCGRKVVIATHRGLEIGQHLGFICSGSGQFVSAEQMRAYAEASDGEETYRLQNGRILREATQADLAEFRHIEDTAFDKLEICRRFAQGLGLNMKIVDCEQILGGERIVFCFMADQRIDFRQLVRQLASEFQTRIEMRQIGARDEARLLADYETCGRECCCKNFLKALKPIGMAMAKLQKTTLDVAKVSGRCGRLKCCLRYENECYETLSKKLPGTGTWVSTPQGIGRVVDRQVLTQLCKVKTEDGQVIAVAVEDILETNLPAPPARGGHDAETDAKPDLAPQSQTGPDRSPEQPCSEKHPDAAATTPPPPGPGDHRLPPSPETTSAPANGSAAETPGDTNGAGPASRPKRRRRGRPSRRGRRQRGGNRSSGPSSSP